MSLFGALFTGTSSLAAQSQNTAMISNNIANVSTTGFKRSEAFFDSLVTTQSRLSRFSPGTVSVTRVQRVDQQGPIQQTSSATDAAISGNGMFPVKRSTDFGQEFLYTRSGSFSEDSQGLLRNTAGFVLYGWPINSNGDLPANQGDLSSLLPVDVAFLGGLTRPTTAAELAINVDADQNSYNTGGLVNDGGAPAVWSLAGNAGSTGFPIARTNPAHFSRGLTIFDELGSAQTVTLEFRKTDGPMASVRSLNTSIMTRDTQLATLPNFAAGMRFSVQTSSMGAPQVYSIGAAFAGAQRVDTLGELIDHLNETVGGGTQIDASLTSNGQLLIRAKNMSDTLTLAETNGTPLFGATSIFNMPNPNAGVSEIYRPFTLNGLAAQSTENPYGYTDNTLSNNQGDFPELENATTPNPSGWWELKILHPNGSTISEGLLNYNGDGTMNASADTSGNIDIELSAIDWGNGSSPQNFRIDVERFSQFAGNYDVIFSDQNGAELGLRTGVELTRDGIVVARFSNGASADLYKVPLVTFANSNGLQEVSGTAYTETEESGEENLREAGTGGAGFVEPSTLETSNVDIADEFAKLIISQRTFTASTRIINTVDQMTEDLIRLR
ncbi:MAG: flagellar hook-basal body complex protein [Alphaproteobacteria bacterium]|nr:flagellar hook-basal body complex protein [Alphaproteobacteria bacterium]